MLNYPLLNLWTTLAHKTLSSPATHPIQNSYFPLSLLRRMFPKGAPEPHCFPSVLEVHPPSQDTGGFPYLEGSCIQMWSHQSAGRCLHWHRGRGHRARRGCHSAGLWSPGGIGTDRNPVGWGRCHHADTVLECHIHWCQSHTSVLWSLWGICTRTGWPQWCRYFHLHRGETGRHRSIGTAYLRKENRLSAAHWSGSLSHPQHPTPPTRPTSVIAWRIS